VSKDDIYQFTYYMVHQKATQWQFKQRKKMSLSLFSSLSVEIDVHQI